MPEAALPQFAARQSFAKFTERNDSRRGSRSERRAESGRRVRIRTSGSTVPIGHGPSERRRRANLHALIGQTISHFRITAKLGEGGMGEVYRATDTRLSRDVAVKVLPEAFAQDSERLARFEREARVLAALSHPSIASIYGIEQDENRSYLILELAEGESLSERLAAGPMPVHDAIAAGLQIAQALEAAHEKAIIHRDLKPANIKIGASGQVKVLDFGLAKALEEERARPAVSMTHSPTVTGMTSPGVLLGTAAYMSPEQVRGHPADRRSDVWAFGLVLYEMLSGNQAFAEPTLSETLASVLRSDIDWKKLPPETPSSIRRLLRRCLERDVRKRLPEMGAARLELQESLDGREQEEGTAPSAAPAVSATPTRAPRLPWAVAAVALLAAAGLAAYALRIRRGGEAPVVHASVPPSPAAEFSLLSGNTPVLSPDGRRLAFAAADKDGRISLYTRRLDAPQAVLLPGTEGAAYPFWSPDGRSIGFFSDAKLKSVEADGGPPVVICEAPNGKGGSWNEAGQIVFAPSNASPLLRVPAGGGEPKQWSRLDEKRGDISHRHPRFLPGGRDLLYVVVGRNKNLPDHAILAAPLEGGPEELIVRSPAAVEYSAGHLLFLRDRTLMARPFDARRLEFTGEAFSLVESIHLLSLSSAVAVFSASRDGVLTYQIAATENRGTLTWSDGEGRDQGTLGAPGDYRMVAVSPDGKFVVASLRVPPARTRDFWLFDVARNVSSRFTFDPGEESQPVWSTDGRTLFYSGPGKNDDDVFRKGVDGTEPVRISDAPGNEYALAISFDGRFLATARESKKTNYDIWIIPLDGGEPRLFLQSPTLDLPGAFSPDGRWLAYVSNETGDSEIYVTSFPAPGRKWQVSKESGIYAHWSDDGRQILFQRTTGELRIVEVDTRGGAVVIGPERALFRAEPPGPAVRAFGATGDFRRFLRIAYDDKGDRPLGLVTNWPAAWHSAERR